MIELNCSYEESKKILELGYDFSKICIEWQHNFYPPNGDPSKGKIVKWFRLGEYLVNPTLTGMLTHHEVDLLNTYTIDSEEALADLKNYKMGDEHTPLIPITPKAALEACLPDFLCVKDFYGELDRSRFVKRLCNGMIDLNSQDSMTVSHDWFNSAYEAFIWCHEHHPEELRKKFEEVMG